MSIVKSFSVGNGDMFYINHSSSNFTVIDCCLNYDRTDEIIEEIKQKSQNKKIHRFISTHPDEDHIRGLEKLDEEWEILNFYCVYNEAYKKDETDSFNKYCELRDSNKSFYLYKDCSRKWMNQEEPGDGIGRAGINIYWPETSNPEYIKALKDASKGGSPNNISPIIRYSVKNGGSFMWMGDLERDFMESISNKLNLPKTNVLFAPHHGRDSGSVPSEILNNISPDIIVIGEAPSEHLNYYHNYFTITQNSAGDITFKNENGAINVYCSDRQYAKRLGDKAKEKGKRCTVNQSKRLSESEYAFTLIPS